MQFLPVSIVAPVLIAWLLPKLLGVGDRYRPLLYAACLVYVCSWYLPSPMIEGMETESVKHFVGGGVFTGLLWIYVKRAKDWRANTVLEAASLFALVSALGVLNELFEFVLYYANLMPNGLADTSWDLAANTLGALVVFIVYRLSRMYGSDRRN